LRDSSFQLPLRSHEHSRSVGEKRALDECRGGDTATDEGVLNDCPE
jgi:hypothetical protein